MDVDLSEFRKLGRPRWHKLPCPVPAALAAVGKEKVALQAALDSDEREIMNSMISRWLSKRGVNASFKLISRHRQQTCTCHD